MLLLAHCTIWSLRASGRGALALEGSPEGDKVMRMSARSAKIEAGYVLLPERAPWLQDFQTEILRRPLSC